LLKILLRSLPFTLHPFAVVISATSLMRTILYFVSWLR
jgi:hypothetical protein